MTCVSPLSRLIRASICALLIGGTLSIQAVGQDAQLKPRIVVLTDISTWEPDDAESLVRLLAHADLFEIEGLVLSTGYSLNPVPAYFINLIHKAIDAYEKDLPNLRMRSKQTDNLSDTTRQEIGYWPSADYLRDRTVFGSRNRGQRYIGSGNDSEGSKLITELADEDDDRPVWIAVWGGGNTLAQSIWSVQQNRTEAQLKAFLNKLRVYTIADQDRHYDGSEGYDVSSHQWMRRDFADDLLFIWDECAWRFHNRTGSNNWMEYQRHIQSHGNLGSVYPDYVYGVEGDTPSFLHIMPTGLNDPEIPTQVSWGGYSEWGMTADNETTAYTNHVGRANSVCYSYESRFYQATFNNFAARMDWAKDGEGNQNPIVSIDGESGFGVIKNTSPAGSTVTLDASGSTDPDGDALTFKWWVQPEAGTLFARSYGISNADSSVATVDVPPEAEGKTFHVILELTDSGTPELSSYRRIVFEPTVSTSVENVPDVKDDLFGVSAYPNPSSGWTNIRYTLARGGHTRVSIFDQLGRVVDTLVDDYEDPGSHEVLFNTGRYPAGVLFGRIESGSHSSTIKILSLR